MMEAWPFAESPNVAVFVSRRIIDGEEWVYYVCHHEDDGAWVFHPKSGLTPDAEVKVVGLNTMVELDPSIGRLADLPLGWCAWRDKPDAEWERGERAE